jgi:hydrogenase/urease accessory protein HupE
MNRSISDKHQCYPAPPRSGGFQAADLHQRRFGKRRSLIAKRPAMTKTNFVKQCVAVLFLCALSAKAHDLPLSYVDLRINNEEIAATIEGSAKNLARELPDIDEATLLDSSANAPYQNQILSAIASRLTIRAGDKSLSPELRLIEPLPDRKDIRLQVNFPAAKFSDTIHIRCALFGFDPRHKTFLNIYLGEQLKYQGIFDRETTQIDYIASAPQNIFPVIRQFVWEGIHHIFIGPDHILFIVGLMLLGGTIGQLLKIVTAFTAAHSLTLVLATLNILNPPAQFVEPVIALSIVFVGAHALIQENAQRDWRMIFAFAFGLVHGFGFASVLREMALPRAALGWSLFSFNAGVELGQACIVMTILSVSVLFYWRGLIVTQRFVKACAFGVVFAGAFWFAQRTFG